MLSFQAPASKEHEHSEATEGEGAFPSTFTIVVEPPDTACNFTAFNVPCDVLDSDFLMQPVNEADYDSETQACVDRKEGTHTSFYSHYVTKRRKKKGLKNCGIESPVPRNKVRVSSFPNEEGSATPQEVMQQRMEYQINSNASSSSNEVKTVSRGASHGAGVNPERGVDSASGRNINGATGHVATLDSSMLMAPTCLGTTYGVQKGALSNAAVRRVACGRMPPMSFAPQGTDTDTSKKEPQAANTPATVIEAATRNDEGLASDDKK